MIGTVHNSYIRGNAIHHTYNRAVTVHGVHFLRIQNNVAYLTMGHTIFIEDAAETNNVIEDNLIIDVRQSWSLLNTDQSPAGMWITHPNNIFRRNTVAGSAFYGFWFDLKDTSTGPSTNPNIVPKFSKLGEFKDNIAHSVGKYGLRVFHIHAPRVDPRKAISDTNPSIPAVYENFFGYHCRRMGTIVSFSGDVTIKNATEFDNILGGIEYERIDHS